MNYQQFRSLVNEMRVAQKRYFKERSGDVLSACKRLEHQVDKALGEYDDGQQEMFDNDDAMVNENDPEFWK